jgi:periplasmic divalent cation tolerance protein
MTDALVVLTTTENEADAERLARLIVEAGLAACVQVLPRMSSIYRWQGKIEQSSETLLLIKTTRAVYLQLETTIKQNHSYETPEIVALSVETGSDDYLNWLKSSVRL